jgi:hypothetical protein
MTTTMEQNQMNEFNQIREQFLADTRQHFFADDASISKTHSATRQNNNPCRCSTHQQRCGSIGA